MQALFVLVLNMSIKVSYIIPAVLLTRFFLQRAPKKYSYILWSVVLYRLMCPASFLSRLSIFGLKPLVQWGVSALLRYVPSNVGQIQTQGVADGIPIMNAVIDHSLPQATSLAVFYPLQQWIALATILWCVGMLILLLHNLVAYIRIKRHAATAVHMESNIFESDSIQTPFILGLLRPRILIPFGLFATERVFILRHEQLHLQRKDQLIKLIGFALLVVHWFNPLVWLSFSCMVKDMEMSCDEMVLSEAGTGIARQYSTSLLSLATNRRFPAASTLAFGETDVRQRVINILRFRKPEKWQACLAAIACALMVTACAANPLGNDPGYNLTGGAVIAGGNSIKAAYQRFDGLYRHEINLSQGLTRFTVITNGGIRVATEDEDGHQLWSSVSRHSAVLLAGVSSTTIADMMEIDVKTPGTYFVVVEGVDYDGSFLVSWWKPSE